MPIEPATPPDAKEAARRIRSATVWSLFTVLCALALFLPYYKLVPDPYLLVVPEGNFDVAVGFKIYFQAGALGVYFALGSMVMALVTTIQKLANLNTPMSSVGAFYAKRNNNMSALTVMSLNSVFAVVLLIHSRSYWWSELYGWNVRLHAGFYFAIISALFGFFLLERQMAGANFGNGRVVAGGYNVNRPVVTNTGMVAGGYNRNQATPTQTVVQIDGQEMVATAVETPNDASYVTAVPVDDDVKNPY